MPRVSTKENKNPYFKKREELGLTREQAEDLLDTIDASRLEKIENERSLPNPGEVLELSAKYKAPELCNYFCSHQCELGKVYVPEIATKAPLSEIVLEMLDALNKAQDKQREFISITADGKVDDSELGAFVDIQKSLEQISVAVEELQLWTERMLASGAINKEKYQEILKQ